MSVADSRPESRTVSAEQLSVLNLIARQATLDLELRPMLQRICDALYKHFSWDLVALVSIDQRRDRFTCEALTTELETEARVGWGRELGSGVVGEVAATGRAVLVNDAREYPNFVDVFSGARAELCVPVKHRGETVAVLNLESRVPYAFSDQVELLHTVAEQIAGAIAAGRRYQAVKQRVSVLEMASDLVRTATLGTDLDSMMQRIAEYLVVRLGMLVAAVLLYDEERDCLVVSVELGSDKPSIDRGKEWPATVGVVGRVLQSGEATFVPDVTEDPDYLELNAEVVAEYVVPIKFQERVIGILNLESDDVTRLDHEARELIDLLAEHVAGAMHMAKVNRDLKELGRSLERKSRQTEALNEQLSDANRQLQRLSRLDPLTGVANRRQFDEALVSEWRRARRDSKPLALVLIDLDHFKRYNDWYGHQAGDECLRMVADALRSEARRAGDLVARYGGEEFAVLLSATDTDAGRQRALELCAAIARCAIEHQASPVADWVTGTAGVASLIPVGKVTPDEIVAAADRALYRAKRAGRNRVEAAARFGASGR